MRLELLLPAAIVLTLGTSQANPIEQADGQGIHGTWTLISNQDGGRNKSVPDDLIVTITQDKIAFASKSRPKSELIFTLDPSTNPKSIDLTVRGESWLGIYKLTADMLTICVNDENGGKRSTSFESKPSSHNNILMVFKRTKP